MESKTTHFRSRMVVAGALIASLALLYSWSFLLFHTAAELLSFGLGLSLFLVAWNVRGRLDHDFLLLIAVALFSSGTLDFLHAVLYKGMNTVPGFGANEPTQLWIAARLLQSSAIALSPVLLRRGSLTESGRFLLLGAFFAAGIVAAAMILHTDIFPVCYEEGIGLTPFKIAAEYFVIGFYGIGLVGIRRARSSFAPVVIRNLSLFLALSIVSELLFTVYFSVFDVFNVLGHIAKVAASMALYQAVIVTGVRRPVELLFRDLAEREKALKEREISLRSALEEKELLMREASHRTKNNFTVLTSLLSLKEADEPSEAIRQSYREMIARVRSMALVHEKLFRSRDAKAVEFADYAADVCGELSLAYSKNHSDISIEYDIQTAWIPIDTASVLGMILSELMTNAFKHAFPPGFQGVKVVHVGFTHTADGEWSLLVHDSGVGLPSGALPKKEGSLGFTIVPALARQIGARYEIDGEGGTSWVIRIPDVGIRTEYREPGGEVPEEGRESREEGLKRDNGPETKGSHSTGSP